jgi:NAD(P)-dependent dehydrogenase (short-subunit alcohol dehydrogenase family)
MISDFKGKTAVLTGGASGFGLECARIGASLGMNLVIVDVQADALKQAHDELKSTGATVMAKKVDVSNASAMQELANAVFERFGAPHFVFNNAGVGAGGLVWENTVQDWEWLLGVNLWGVIHGVRLFTPMMLEAAKQDPHYQGHIVNTASMAGLLTPPNMGIYNVTKHAVVSLTETLYQDLKLVSDQVSAAQVAQMVFDAMHADQFYIYSHPKALGNAQTRFDAIVQGHNPPDPFAERPDIGVQLRQALRG